MSSKKSLITNPINEKELNSADVYKQNDEISGMDAYTIKQYIYGQISHFSLKYFLFKKY